MEREHFVYSHTSPSGKVYIGQAVNVKRRWGTNGEHYRTKKKNGEYIQPVFARAIDKYGWKNFEHKVLLDGQTKEAADYAERYLISWYKHQGLSYNITEGGEGTCGAKHALSEERKKAIAIFMQTNHPMKGKHHTQETKDKISKASKGRKLSEERRQQMSLVSKGRKHSEEAKLKLSEYKKTHPETWIGGWNKKEVHQYNLEGIYLNSYSSATEASQELNIAGSDILRCINSEVKSAGGFIWKPYKEDKVNVDSLMVRVTSKGTRLYDMSEEGKRKRSASHGKPVNQYTVEGEYIATFCNASEASRKTGINRSGIQRCCNKKDTKYKTAGGCLWEFDLVTNRCNKTIE